MKYKINFILLLVILNLTHVKLSFATLKNDNIKNAKVCRLLNNKGIFPENPANIVPKLLKIAGAKVIQLRNARDFALRKKSNFADLKSKGDCTSQNFIFSELKKTFPQHDFFGEEKCTKSRGENKKPNKTRNVLWILDPIDGTTNYVHGLSHFSISLALVIENTVCYGVVYSPVFNELFFAEKGKGAFIENSGKKPVRLHVSSSEKFSESLWVTGFKAGHKNKIDPNIDIIQQILLQTHGIRRHGSAALDLAHVAAGRTEGYWELFMDWWDIAAGLLLVEEAGGKVLVIYPKDTKENSIDYKKPTLAVMASNGKKEIHTRMTNILLPIKQNKKSGKNQ